MPPVPRLTVLSTAALVVLGVVAASPAAAATPTHTTKVSWTLTYSKYAGGFLQAAGTASGPVGRAVYFQRSTASGWKTIATGTTNSTHHFTLKTSSTGAGTFKFKVYVPVKGTWKSASGTTSKATVALNGTKATIKAAAKVVWGHKVAVAVAGTTSKYDPVRTVVLQRASGTTWKTVATQSVTASKAGTCVSGSTAKNICTTVNWPAPASGTPKLRVVVRATALSHSATSNTVAVTVVLATPKVFTGESFDTASAPALSTMTAWSGTSPYGGVGVYIGGANRWDQTQANLTASWVKSVTADGWKLVPIYMGAQAPCTTRTYLISTDLTTAATQGTTDAADAVSAAKALGMQPGSAIYLDMENYNVPSGDTTCAPAVLAYTRAWDKALHSKGYWAGFYSSSSSGIKRMSAAATAGTTDLPDIIWFANWNGVDDTTESSNYLLSTQWTGHRRGHQYKNGAETWGDVKVNIDGSAWDAPVAVIG
ncbi:DUF1906 domain-containing protein [Streptomyces sp. NBC_01537]|uniref:DUF1906 domain-containing protein n=1 Tax=Streptomyces sp. NBC_01537 TaxID=2903896 RepID=UPI003866F041